MSDQLLELRATLERYKTEIRELRHLLANAKAEMNAIRFERDKSKTLYQMAVYRAEKLEDAGDTSSAKLATLTNVIAKQAEDIIAMQEMLDSAETTEQAALRTDIAASIRALHLAPDTVAGARQTWVRECAARVAEGRDTEPYEKFFPEPPKGFKEDLAKLVTGKEEPIAYLTEMQAKNAADWAKAEAAAVAERDLPMVEGTLIEEERDDEDDDHDDGRTYSEYPKNPKEST